MIYFTQIFMLLLGFIGTFGWFIIPLNFPINTAPLFLFLIIITCSLYLFVLKANPKMKKSGLLLYIILLLLSSPLLIQGAMLTMNVILRAYMSNSKFTFPLFRTQVISTAPIYYYLFLIMLFIPFIYLLAHSIIKRKHLFLSFLLSLFFLAVPLLFNLNPDFIFVVCYLCCFATMFILKIVYKQQDASLSKVQWIVMLLVFLSIQAITVKFPEKEYVRIDWIEEIRTHLNQESLDYFINLFNSKKENGDLDLLSTGNRYYSGKTDLTIEASIPTNALLKGISYMTYQDNIWSNPKENTGNNSVYIEREKELNSMMSSYLENLSTNVNERTSMSYQDNDFKIENTSTPNDYIYTPYYLNRNNDFLYSQDNSFGYYYKAVAPNYQVFFYDLHDLSVFQNNAWINETIENYVYSRYLQIPDTLKETLLTYMADIINPSLTQEQQIDKIITLLKNNAEYTLSPGITPNNQDFIEYFLLENKRGYCVHFASSATMMLRAIGIPARYVEGYSLRQSDFEGNTAYVKDNQAHAWIEVYFDTFGWVPYDVTPPATITSSEEYQEQESELIETPENNTPSNTTSNTNTTTDIEEAVREEKTFSYSLLLLLVIPLVYLLYLTLRKRYYHTSNIKVNILRYYQSMLRLTKYQIPIMKEAEDLALEVRFSNHDFTHEHLRLMESYYQEYLQLIKEKANIVQKIFINLFYK